MKLNYLIGIAALVLAALSFQSCLDDDKYVNYNYPNALVTVKQASDESVFLQLDDKTTLLPVNLKSHPFGGKEVRALVNYEEVDQAKQEYSKAVKINWIDSIRTKVMVPDFGEENDEKYGIDPVEIVKDWVTIAEDGYLTLRFRTLWGSQNVAHHVNLVFGGNPENPYEVEFRHNAFGDTHGVANDALVAFKLDKLPDTKGEKVKLKLKWKSFSGDKSTEFDYTTQEATPAKKAVEYSPNRVNVQ